MNYLDNTDKELEDSRYVLESLKRYSNTKLKDLYKIKKERLPSKRKTQKYNKKKVIKKRNRILGVLKDYNEHINSSYWTNRKNKYYQKHKRICRACGSTKFIQLHHTYYANFGNELDKHLVPLCSKCHKQLHKEYGTHKRMIRLTNHFIKKKQNSKN